MSNVLSPLATRIPVLPKKVSATTRIPAVPVLRRLAAVAVLSGGLAGCVVGPDYALPTVELPNAWEGDREVATADAPELAEWWTKLGDPVLNQLIEEAVDSNLDVRTAKARIRQARANYRAAGGALYPSVDGSASASRSKGGANVGEDGEIRSSAPTNRYQAGFDASWELDLFGANTRALEAAKYGLDAAEEELRNTLLTLIGDVAENYVTARGLQARLKLARQTTKAQYDTADLTRFRFEAGAVSGLDVASAEASAASTEANIPSIESDYTQTVNRLSVLLGLPPAALRERLAEPESVPQPPLPIAAGIPAQVLMARPDVRLAERQFAQSTAQVGAAEAALYPSLSLTGSISTSAAQVGNLSESSSIGWAFGPSLVVPIFNGGQLRAALAEAAAVRDESYVGYQQSVLTALEDVENAMVALAKQSQRAEVLAKSERASMEAADLSRSLYKNGSVSFLDVLDAERTLYAAEDARIQAQVAIATSYVALNKALGGGWDGAVDSSTPEIEDGYTGPRLNEAIADLFSTENTDTTVE